MTECVSFRWHRLSIFSRGYRANQLNSLAKCHEVPAIDGPHAMTQMTESFEESPASHLNWLPQEDLGEFNGCLFTASIKKVWISSIDQSHGPSHWAKMYGNIVHEITVTSGVMPVDLLACAGTTEGRKKPVTLLSFPELVGGYGFSVIVLKKEAVHGHTKHAMIVNSSFMTKFIEARSANTSSMAAPPTEIRRSLRSASKV